MQGFFSPVKYQRDLERFESKVSSYHPEGDVEKARAQIAKYAKIFDLPMTDVFLLVPTLFVAHRKKYTTTIPEYYEYFEKTSGLSRDNFVLLSENMRLDLSRPKQQDLEPTGNFELMLLRLHEKG